MNNQKRPERFERKQIISDETQQSAVETGLTKQSPDLGKLSSAELRHLVRTLQDRQTALEKENETLRQTQQQLIAERNKYAALYEFSPLGYFTLDEEGLILKTNPAGAKLVGLAQDELRNQALAGFICDADQETYHYHQQRLFETQSPQTYEICLIGADKAPRYVRLTGIAVRDSQDQRCYHIALNDITEPKQTAESLRESEEKFSKVFYDSPIPMQIANLKTGRYIDLNQRLIELWGHFGYSPEALRQNNFLVDHPWVDDAAQKKGIKQLLEERVVHNYPAKMVSKTGEIRHLLVSGAMLDIGDGNLACVAYIDMTMQKETERALLENEARFRALFEKSGYAVGLARAGITVMVNPAYLALFGYTDVAEVIGNPLLNDIAPAERPRLQAFIQRRDSGESVPTLYETRGIRRDGTIFELDVKVSTYELGGEIYSVGILRDITDQKRTEQERQRLYEQVQRHAAELEQRVADRTRELAALYQVAAIAGEATDLPAMLEAILDCTLQAMRCKGGGIHLLDESGSQEARLTLVVQRGLPDELYPKMASYATDQGLPGLAFSSGEPVASSDLSTDPRASSPVPSSWAGGIFAPIRGGGQTLGVFSLIAGQDEAAFTVDDVALMISICDQIGRAIETARLRNEARQAAVLAERERLARELHDSITQSLYSLTLFAEWASDLCQAGDLKGVQTRLTSIGQTAHQSLKEMRLLLYELQPSLLAQDGLRGALQRRLDAVERRLDTEVCLEVTSLNRLPAETEFELYRIAQEALNNALKHAQAKQVTVRLTVTDGWLTLVVEDDGLGFDPQSSRNSGGMGLTNIRRRAEALGGTLTVRSAPGEGTTIQVGLEIEVG